MSKSYLKALERPLRLLWLGQEEGYRHIPRPCVVSWEDLFWKHGGGMSVDEAVGMWCPSQRCWGSQLSQAAVVNVSGCPCPLLWAGDLRQHSSGSEFHGRATLCNTSLAQEALWHGLLLVQS